MAEEYTQLIKKLADCHKCNIYKSNREKPRSEADYILTKTICAECSKAPNEVIGRMG